MLYNFDFTVALHKFNEENGFLPVNIIVYRDGVGDGQLEYVQRYEIGQMKQCFNTMQVQ
jgi:aubergine-like protein